MTYAGGKRCWFLFTAFTLQIKGSAHPHRCLTGACCVQLSRNNKMSLSYICTDMICKCNMHKTSVRRMNRTQLHNFIFLLWVHILIQKTWYSFTFYFFISLVIHDDIENAFPNITLVRIVVKQEWKCNYNAKYKGHCQCHICTVSSKCIYYMREHAAQH